jgi:hypothetical protein
VWKDDLIEPVGGFLLLSEIHVFLPNKALQLTPSRLASLSYDRFSFPSTLTQEFSARSGQLSLALGYKYMKTTIQVALFSVFLLLTTHSSKADDPPIRDGSYLLTQQGDWILMPVEVFVTSKDGHTSLSIPSYKIKDAEISSKDGIAHFCLRWSTPDNISFILLFTSFGPQDELGIKGIASGVTYQVLPPTAPNINSYKSKFLLVPTSKVIQRAQQDAAANP